MLIFKLVDDVVIVLANVCHVLQLLYVFALSPFFFFSLLPQDLLFLLSLPLDVFFLHLFYLLLADVGFALLLLAADIAGVIAC